MTKNKKVCCVVGTKQTIKAIKQQSAIKCYIAKDADYKVTKNVEEMCNKNNIKLEYIQTMKELGHLFKMNVGAASAAELKQT